MRKDRKAHGKIHKILHSRYFWAVLGLALSFVQLLVVFILLYKFFMPITVLAIMFHVGVLLYVINRDEIPELKVPWLMILFLFPVIGAFIFMLFSSTEQSKKEIKKLEDARKRIQAYQEQSPEIMEELKVKDLKAYVQANYLYHAAGMPCRRANAVYYRLGEEFHDALLESLKQVGFYP